MFRQLARALPKGTVRMAPKTALRSLGSVTAHSFHTTNAKAPQQAAAAPAAPAAVEDDGGLGHIIKKYGTTPFVGLLGTALMSKEIMLFNEEFLLFLVWGSFCGTAYIQLGDTVNKYFQDMIDERANTFDDAMDMYIQGVHVYKEKQQWQIDQVAVLEQVASEYQNMLQVSYAAKNLALRNHAHDTMLTKLQQIQTQENLAAAKANEEMVEKCLSAVWAEFSAGKMDAKVKSSILDNAIDSIGPGKPMEANDPVRQAFIKHLQQK